MCYITMRIVIPAISMAALWNTMLDAEDGVVGGSVGGGVHEQFSQDGKSPEGLEKP